MVGHEAELRIIFHLNGDIYLSILNLLFVNFIHDSNGSFLFLTSHFYVKDPVNLCVMVMVKERK